MMQFKKAVKAKQRLRLAIDGVSGSGKTYTALAIASGMGNKIAMIDSEHGSAALYGDRFDFDTLELESFQIEDYIGALNMAASAEYPIVIIDSTSHAWDALVERVERVATQKFSGNTFRGWGEGTPLQKKLIEAMLNYPGHVLVTCRSKTEYSVEKNDKGQTMIKKVGTAAVQRQGFEYEFTMAMTMDANHVGFVSKDRTSKFQDKFIEKPGKDFGKELIAWLNEGAEDLVAIYDAKKKEIGNILNTTDEEGPLFTEEEIEAVRVELRSLSKIPIEEKIPIIENILHREKQEMLKRIEAAKIPAAPTTPVRNSPRATRFTPPPEPSTENSEPDIPEMYSEEEDPADDDQVNDLFEEEDIF